MRWYSSSWWQIFLIASIYVGSSSNASVLFLLHSTCRYYLHSSKMMWDYVHPLASYDGNHGLYSTKLEDNLTAASTRHCMRWTVSIYWYTGLYISFYYISKLFNAHWSYLAKLPLPVFVPRYNSLAHWCQNTFEMTEPFNLKHWHCELQYLPGLHRLGRNYRSSELKLI